MTTPPHRSDSENNEVKYEALGLHEKRSIVTKEQSFVINKTKLHSG
jgi:hypothetical protein